MAFSGISGAVGMAIESLFCTVPLSGTAAPFTAGAPSTNPMRFCAVEPGNGIPGEPVLDLKPEIDGMVEQRRITLLGKQYKGDISLRADSENLYYPMLGIIGRDLQTTVQVQDASHSPAMYKHVFTPAKTVPSFTVEEQMGDGLNGRLTSGAVIEEVTLDFGDIVTAVIALVAHRQIPNTYPDAGGVSHNVLFGSVPAVLPLQMGGDGAKTVVQNPAPSFVDVQSASSGNGPLVFAAMGYGTQIVGGFLTVNGAVVPVQLLPGSRIVLKRAVDSRQVAGSGYDPGAILCAEFTVTGRLVCLYQDMSLPAAQLSFSQCALNLKVNGPAVGTSGAAASVEVWLPHIKLQRAPVPHAAGAIVINADFTAMYDTASGHSVQITLVNSLDATQLGGSAASSGGPGGPGGWLAS